MKPTEGDRLVAGGELRATVAKRLGLPGQGVTASGWTLGELDGTWPDRVRLAFSNPGGGFVCYLRPPDAADHCLATKSLAISYEGQELPAGMDRFVAHLARRLDAWGFAGLMKRLVEGGQRRAPGVGDDPPDEPGCFTGPPDRLGACWRRFICDQEFPELDAPRWLDPAMVSIQYGDRECTHAAPQEGPAFWNVLNFPEQGPAAADELGALNDQRVLNFELDDEAVVLGTEAIQQRLLAATELVADEAVAYVFDHLCTPLVIGDDLDGLTRRCQERTGRPVVPLSFDIKDRGEGFQSLVKAVGPDLQAAAEGRETGAVTIDPKAVNLLGFGARYRDEELGPLLEGLGLRLSAQLLPDLRVAELHKLAGAAWNIQPAHSRFVRMLQESLGDAGVPILEVPAPYGVAGSRACYDFIAEATGSQAALADAWAACYEPRREAWERGQAEARRHRLGVILDETGWDQLAQPARLGVPLLSLLKELGFVVEALSYQPVAAQPPPAAVEALLDDVVPYQDRQDLQQQLAARDYQAVYSDLGFDWRLSSAGCGQFSRQDLEPGVAGGLRSLERLLATCRTPFYRRYARHLAPDRGGAHA